MQVGHAESGVAGLPSEAQQLTCANPITGSETCGDGLKMRAVVPDSVITDQAHESTTASPRLVETRVPAIDAAHCSTIPDVTARNRVPLTTKMSVAG